MNFTNCKHKVEMRLKGHLDFFLTSRGKRKKSFGGKNLRINRQKIQSTEKKEVEKFGSYLFLL